MAHVRAAGSRAEWCIGVKISAKNMGSSLFSAHGSSSRGEARQQRVELVGTFLWRHVSAAVDHFELRAFDLTLETLAELQACLAHELLLSDWRLHRRPPAQVIGDRRSGLYPCGSTPVVRGRNKHRRWGAVLAARRRPGFCCRATARRRRVIGCNTSPHSCSRLTRKARAAFFGVPLVQASGKHTFTISSSVVTVRQLRAVASTPRSLSARSASLDVPNPSGV